MKFLVLVTILIGSNAQHFREYFNSSDFDSYSEGIDRDALNTILHLNRRSHRSSWSKVSPGLRDTMMMRKNAIDILVMIEETDSVLARVTSRYTRATTHEQRAYSVHQALTAHADRTQRSTLEFLSTQRSNRIKSYWINNMIWVQGANQDLIKTLADRPEVSEIFEDEIIYLDDRVDDMGELSTIRQDEKTWGIKTIRAPEAWRTTSGQGAIVGIIDTGARHTNKVIKDSYMGLNANKYASYNPYRPTDSEPNDLHGHGTHVTGTIAGKYGIGVAPDSKWISCKGLNDGPGTTVNIIACMQFMACPHHHLGPSGGSDCSQAPRIVSNSYGGNPLDTAKDSAIRAWLAINIWPVYGAGNDGPECMRMSSSADSVEGVISVGATTEDENCAYFSSKGPVIGREGIYPLVSAPGNKIKSAGIESDNAYTEMSGTSMACPHVSGVLALMASYKPNLSYHSARNALTKSANTTAPVSKGETCAGISDTQWPNYSFGHGRIDAVEALRII